MSEELKSKMEQLEFEVERLGNDLRRADAVFGAIRARMHGIASDPAYADGARSMSKALMEFLEHVPFLKKLNLFP